MTDRRRCPRYVLLAPLNADADTVSDCIVETWSGDRAVVLTAHAAEPGEGLILRPDSSPGSGPYVMHVVSSAPDVASGHVRFRLEVTLPSVHAHRLTTCGVVWRRIDVRVLDVSSGGCRLQSSTPLTLGTIGSLAVDADGQQYGEWFRICRTDPARLANGSWHAAAEFLPLGAVGWESLRRAVGRFCVEPPPPALPRSAGRSSGDNGRSASERSGGAPASKGESAEFAQKIVDFSTRRHTRNKWQSRC